MSANRIVTAQALEPKIVKPYNVHEISAYATIGIENISYKFNHGSHNKGLSGGIGVNYAYNIDEHFAVVSGLGLASYYGRLKMNNYEEKYLSADNYGEEFGMRYTIAGEYREKQNIILLYIPVMARYSLPLSFLGDGSIKYFVMGGMKLGIPFVARATIDPYIASTYGYYEYEGIEYSNVLPEYGFTDKYSSEKTKSRIRFGVAPLLSLETGVHIPIGYKYKLTAGFYVDYCFANVHKSDDRHILEYQSSLHVYYNYNSIMNTDAIKKITLFNSGIKVGILF
jgi:hypothetical protein